MVPRYIKETALLKITIYDNALSGYCFSWVFHACLPLGILYILANTEHIIVCFLFFWGHLFLIRNSHQCHPQRNKSMFCIAVKGERKIVCYLVP